MNDIPVREFRSDTDAMNQLTEEFGEVIERFLDGRPKSHDNIVTIVNALGNVSGMLIANVEPSYQVLLSVFLNHVCVQVEMSRGAEPAEVGAEAQPIPEGVH